ncbi:uncharacterized protein B0T15DRAFT_291644 [Chaetomium strumarium]|uniref:Uncharacterized protein n=1 Tax=Chaetomium strumarium TaxID=1170767 RepID=A0AAJ0GLE2_9PEZI|nr:hypothetical protein B0T15DRAFT_291644 [Chaetomium strumarium]
MRWIYPGVIRGRHVLARRFRLFCSAGRLPTPDLLARTPCATSRRLQPLIIPARSTTSSEVPVRGWTRRFAPRRFWASGLGASILGAKSGVSLSKDKKVNVSGSQIGVFTDYMQNTSQCDTIRARMRVHFKSSSCGTASTRLYSIFPYLLTIDAWDTRHFREQHERKAEQTFKQAT